MNKIKLFCFPFGGGSAATYYGWQQYINKSIIELYPVELAARGNRFGEPNYNSIEEAADDVFNIINSKLKQGKYAFFGHSLGSMIAFELVYKIKKENLPLPVHVFFSGRGAPHMPRDNRKKYHTLPENEFKNEVLKFGGIPEEFVDQPELLELVLTLLRGDFKLAETYSYKEKDDLLNFNITVLSGRKDHDTSEEEIEAWKERTQKKCVIHWFEGGHFFLNEEPEKVVDIINNTLKNITLGDSC